MSRIPVTAIFDIGKTNKKLFLFDEDYRIVYERTARFDEIVDEDNFPCEDIDALTTSVYQLLDEVLQLPEFDIKAINFSTYGASFVYIDEQGKPLTPLYNYLKPYPEALKEQFYQTYGAEAIIAAETASPVLGNLNSGMQLYSLKHGQPDVYKKVSYALHLPQYLSYLITRKPVTDITSIGCHTSLWDFNTQSYHNWVKAEGLDAKFAPVTDAATTTVAVYKDHQLKAGVGLHDSSAALIPYLTSITEPFLLLSTGTWNISLNPFNQTPLTAAELAADCLCYMQYTGRSVKASRYLGGLEHEQQAKRIAEHFNVGEDFYKPISFNRELVNHNDTVVKFADRDLSTYTTPEAAYHQLISDIITQQYQSAQLVLQGSDVKKIYVDGGFSKNPVFMHLLAAAFPNYEVYAASTAQATAMGTALAIHHHWNSKPLPNNIVELKHYTSPSRVAI